MRPLVLKCICLLLASIGIATQHTKADTKMQETSTSISTDVIRLKIVCDAREEPNHGYAETREAEEDTLYIEKTSSMMTVSSLKMGWRLTFRKGVAKTIEKKDVDGGIQNNQPLITSGFGLQGSGNGNNQNAVIYIKITTQLLKPYIAAMTPQKSYFHNILWGYQWNPNKQVWEIVFWAGGDELDMLDKLLIDSFKDIGGAIPQNEKATPPRQSVQQTATPTVKTITLPNGYSFKMTHVGGGNFSYRTTYNRAVSSFYIGQTEVTQALWKAVMKNNPSIDKGDNLPVNNITYQQALSFCKKLSSLIGKKFRLPTDIEWEYAATGGQASQGYLYAGSNEPLEVGWFEENSQGKLHPVGQKRPNELDIYDMSGNVCEMCNDYIDEGHPESENLPGAYRRARGGRWETSGVPIRTNKYDYYSDHYSQGFGTRYVGFRVVME